MFLRCSRKEENSIIGLRRLTRGGGGGAGGGRGEGKSRRGFHANGLSERKIRKHLNSFSIKLSLPRLLGASSGVRPLYRNGVA